MNYVQEYSELDISSLKEAEIIKIAYDSLKEFKEYTVLFNYFFLGKENIVNVNKIKY